MTLDGGTVNSTVAIIICSVVLGVIALPLLFLLVFHIYLTLTGKTTREILKKLESSPAQNNQWCEVDPPLFDPYLEITSMEKIRLDNELGNI